MARQQKKSEPKTVTPQTELDFEWVLMDLGNANSRMWCSGMAKPINWRSVQGHIGHKTRWSSLPSDWSIIWRGTPYVFGERAYGECQDTIDDWPDINRYTDDWYKRMFAFALYRASQHRANPDEPYEPTVIISVPAKEYSNQTRLQMIEEKLIDLYKIETAKSTIVEVDIMENNLNIVPEGLGSFLYTSGLTPDARLDEGLWVVLDLGYLTGDYLEFLDGIYVPDSSDSSDKLGMQYVAQRVADYVHGQNGPMLTAAYVDRKLRNGDTLPVSTKAYPVADEYHAAMTELGDRVDQWLKRKSMNKDIHGILLTGGNIEKQVCFIKFSDLPKPIMCPDGEFGNLLGAHLMLQADL